MKSAAAELWRRAPPDGKALPMQRRKDGKMKVYPDKSFLISMTLQTVDLILG
jgi:hypothetical protein